MLVPRSALGIQTTCKLFNCKECLTLEPAFGRLLKTLLLGVTRLHGGSCYGLALFRCQHALDEVGQALIAPFSLAICCGRHYDCPLEYSLSLISFIGAL